VEVHPSSDDIEMDRAQVQRVYSYRLTTALSTTLSCWPCSGKTHTEQTWMNMISSWKLCKTVYGTLQEESSLNWKTSFSVKSMDTWQLIYW